MTLSEFVNTNNNKYMERVDGSNLNQCFDLAVGYCMDVLGFNNSVFAGLLNAYEIWTKPTPTTGSNFDFIENQLYAVAKPGDIVVFSQKYNGGAGHVGVVVSADINNLQVFEQNDPLKSPCIMKTYSYDYVLGWLRKITNSVAQSELDKAKQTIVNQQATINDLTKQNGQIASEKDKYKGLLNQINGLSKV